MIRDARLLVLPLLFLLLLGCAGSVSDTPSADAPSRKPRVTGLPACQARGSPLPGGPAVSAQRTGSLRTHQ